MWKFSPTFIRQHNDMNNVVLLQYNSQRNLVRTEYQCNDRRW